MGKCVCVVASGPHKGAQCTNQAKPGSKFCGVHKDCKKTIMDVTRQPPQIREPQARQSPQAREPQAHHPPQIREPQTRQSPQIREPQVPQSSETCPDQLRPIDGICPQKFPEQRQLSDGSMCCMTNLRRFRKMKMRPRKVSHA